MRTGYNVQSVVNEFMKHVLTYVTQNFIIVIIILKHLTALTENKIIECG